MADAVSIPLSRIVEIAENQPRLGPISAAHVKSLLEAFDSLPPVTCVVNSAGEYILVDGFHRIDAAHRLGLERIPVLFAAGPPGDDFIGLSFDLNMRHGLPLSIKEKKAHAGRILGKHPDLSDREIARQCALSAATISSIRNGAQNEQSSPTPQHASTADVRQPGTLPEEGLLTTLGNTVAAFVDPATRRTQRPIVSYLQRLAVALDEQFDLAGWETNEEAAAACTSVLKHDGAEQLAGRLGPAANNILSVAEALGYDSSTADEPS
jgi:ParB-like chromosome segregation protein Spo0J